MFVKLWNNRQSISKVNHVQQYLFRSLRNTILTKIASHPKTSFYELLEERYHFEISYPQEHHVIENEAQQESYRQFRLAMDKLTPRQHEIIYLRYMKGMEYEQAAAVMNISVKAAYKLVARSLDTLKENLQQTPYQWPQLFLFLSLLSLFN